MGTANVIKPLAQHEKSPWRSKSTPPGPRGLHPAGVLTRTHRSLEYETQIPTGAAASQVSSKPQGECSHSPRGSGATVGYHKKGYLKQEPKRLLKTSQISKPKDNHRVSADFPTCLKPASQRLSASPRPHSARPRTGYRFSDSPEAPRIKPQTKYRFSDSLEAGSATTSSPPPQQTSPSKHHASNHSHDVSRAWAQYSRVADGT